MIQGLGVWQLHFFTIFCKFAHSMYAEYIWKRCPAWKWVVFCIILLSYSKKHIFSIKSVKRHNDTYFSVFRWTFPVRILLGKFANVTIQSCVIIAVWWRSDCMPFKGSRLTMIFWNFLKQGCYHLLNATGWAVQSKKAYFLYYAA